MELLERESLVAELDHLLGEATSGRGRLVFLGGEAGVGKTALVRHVTESARKTARVLVGACDPLSTPRPLGPALDIAAAVGGALERLLHDPGQARHKVLRGILAELSTRMRPTLAIFEDVHWADEATLDLLASEKPCDSGCSAKPRGRWLKMGNPPDIRRPGMVGGCCRPDGPA